MSLPIDPISHEPIPPERQVKINMLTQEQYFDIDNLHTWFVTRGEPINPLTNIGFTKQQLQDIRARYIALSKPFPAFLHSPDDMKQQEEEKQQEIQFLQQQLNMWCGNVEHIEQVRNLLYTHSQEIEQDQFSINALRNVSYETIYSVTPIMNAVYFDNILAVQELLLFNPELNYVDTKYNYKAIDLAVLSNKPHSTEILKSLLFYGANVNIPTKNGLSVELTDDIAKLELLYGFMYN